MIDKKKAAVFDIDGCISNDLWRLHLAKSGQWDEYFSRAKEDLSCNHDILRGYSQEHYILFITARPERYRTETVEWILRNFGFHSFILEMREDHQLVPAVTYKVNAVSSLKETYNIVAAFDNDPRIVEAYANLEIDTALVLTPEGCRKDAADTLEQAAALWRQRNKEYGDNYNNVGRVLTAMFPDGLHLKTEQEFIRAHLLFLMVMKMTRYNSATHKDSLLDLSVYGAMLLNVIEENEL